MVSLGFTVGGITLLVKRLKHLGTQEYADQSLVDTVEWITEGSDDASENQGWPL